MKLRLLFSVFAVVAAATAGIIRVPSEQPTIQAGLDAAGSGDTVLVAPDTFYENLVWPACDSVTLLSEAGAEATVIDGGGLGRVVRMTAGSYTNNTRLEGFTITGGVLDGSSSRGAGVWCSGSPVICHNRIVRNRIDRTGYGAGVCADGSPVMHHNFVAWDTIANPGGGGFRYGPGVFCGGSGLFYQNTFFRNAALGGAGGFWYGGGLCLWDGEPVVVSNLFLANRIGTTTGGIAYGGGLYVHQGSAYVVNNTFAANVCSTAIAYGGAIYLNRTWTSTVKNNIVAENTAAGIIPKGGGIAAYVDTLHDTLEFDFNDVWGNAPDDYYRCLAGPNALSLDPLFALGAGGHFYLSHIAAGQGSDSPCIDAGDTVQMTTPLDADSLLHAWTTRTDSVVDAGALDLGYHYDHPVQVGVRGRCPPIRSGSLQARVEPNPFRRGAVVRYVTSEPGHVTVRVIDVSGREVAVLFDGSVESGEHRVALKSGLSAGVYFVAVQAAGRCTRLRCTVVE